MSGKPKPAFFVAVGFVVLGLVLFAFYRMDKGRNQPGPGAAKQGTDVADGNIDPNQLNPAPDGTQDASTPESADPKNAASVTTVQEYKFVPSQRLPEVKQGTAAYKPMVDNTVRFALNVWAGWAPILHANNGMQPGKVWKTPDGKEFRVELVLMDDPIGMQDAYAAGDVHIGWGTLDMVPLMLERLVNADGKPRDVRVMPRIFQQVDWSNGGDGIVARDSIRTVADLRGKKIVMAESSPSHYFALNMLVAGGLQPSEVEPFFTQTAFEAAAAFNAKPDIAAAVSWAPDIYNLSEVKGNKLLVSTQVANKLIADVWFARADFAADHPDIVEGLVRGIFDAMEELKSDAARESVARIMGEAYGLPPAEAAGMLGDAHSTNYAENRQFFLNQNNPTNFERVWNQAYYLYRKIGKIRHQQVKFDQIMDFSVIQKLGSEEKYASQKDEYSVQFVPKTTSEIQEAEEILTNTVVIHFFPNSHDLYKKTTESGEERLYDPNVDLILEEIAKLAGQFGAAQIVIEGHTDSSMRGRAPDTLVKELSSLRANAVKEALVQKFPSLDPNQFSTAGLGWDRPADPGDPQNQAKNRRVEIKIYPAESGG